MWEKVTWKTRWSPPEDRISHQRVAVEWTFWLNQFITSSDSPNICIPFSSSSAARAIVNFKGHILAKLLDSGPIPALELIRMRAREVGYTSCFSQRKLSLRCPIKVSPRLCPVNWFFTNLSGMLPSPQSVSFPCLMPSLFFYIKYSIWFFWLFKFHTENSFSCKLVVTNSLQYLFNSCTLVLYSIIDQLLVLDS